jgi:ferredoxin
MQIVVDKEKCPQNHKCPAINICPVGAINQDRFEVPKINQEICIKCGNCIRFCPMGAINYNK